MKHPRFKRLLLAVLAAAAAALCSGCVFSSVDELYALPILPNEYSDLQATIQATVDDLRAEYATISSGDNTSTVQLLDLDAVTGGYNLQIAFSTAMAAARNLEWV